MKKYIVKIINGSGVMVYNELIEATNENEAIEQTLKELIIYSNDEITVEEV